MLPAIIIILVDINPMQALLLSQVCLSFVLPMAIIPLLILTSNRKLMGSFVNTKLIKCIGIVIASVIVILNIILIYTTIMK
jgi:manganese transport protein